LLVVTDAVKVDGAGGFHQTFRALPKPVLMDEKTEALVLVAARPAVTKA
jgi:hypothetical protein